MDPNRRKLLDQLIAEAAAELPDDVDLSTLTDEELLAWLRARRIERPRADGLAAVDPIADPLYQAYLATLPDDELIALHEEAQAEVNAAAAERERRRPKPPEAVVAPPEPPVELHPVSLEPDTPAKPEPTPPETPRQKWQREQDEKIRAAIAEEMAAGERIARLYHELPDDGRYDGPMFGGEGRDHDGGVRR